MQQSVVSPNLTQCINKHERLVYATIEFKARKEGTQLVITERGVFLDDFDDARGRERGTQILINQLEEALHRQSTSARS
jgi:hypothetical protein